MTPFPRSGWSTQCGRQKSVTLEEKDKKHTSRCRTHHAAGCSRHLVVVRDGDLWIFSKTASPVSSLVQSAKNQLHHTPAAGQWQSTVQAVRLPDAHIVGGRLLQHRAKRAKKRSGQQKKNSPTGSYEQIYAGKGSTWTAECWPHGLHREEGFLLYVVFGLLVRCFSSHWLFLSLSQRHGTVLNLWWENNKWNYFPLAHPENPSPWVCRL